MMIKSEIIQPYDRWLEANEEELSINAAESGADRELDYDQERYCEQQYTVYSNQVETLRQRLAYIREYYQMPWLEVGMRIHYHHSDQWGVVVGANHSGGLKIKLDNEAGEGHYHPQWELSYYDDTGTLIESYREDVA